VTAALGIAVSSLQAETTAIDVTAENVANAQTPGYVAQSASFAALPGGGPLGIGDGVAVTSIAQATDALLSTNSWQAQGALSNLGSLQQALSAIENVFPIASAQGSSGASATTTSSASIAGQLATFWSAWDAVAQDPSSAAPRVQIVDDAQGLVAGLSEASTQLAQITEGSQRDLADQVAQVDTLLGQAASLNASIVRTKGGGGNPNQLEDQLRAVQGASAGTLAVEAHGGSAAIVATPGSVAVPVSSGSIAGLLSTLNRYLPQYESQLNAVADSLRTTVNTQLLSGYTATGAAASSSPSTHELFIGSGAPGLAVNPAVAADPYLIAASATPGAAAANNGANAQAMADLGTAPGAPDALYQSLVQSIGADTQSIQSQLEAQTSVATQAQAALQAVSGVDVTAQLTDLLGFQQSYEASAKLLSVADATIQSLLQAVS
jgi:flagellar hook-associated protein 1 FlgK